MLVYTIGILRERERERGVGGVRVYVQNFSCKGENMFVLERQKKDRERGNMLA